MESKDIVKLGTFVRNLVLKNARFQKHARTLGIDQYTEPEYVLDCLKQEIPAEDFSAILEEAKKSPVRDYVDVFLQTT